MALIIKISHLNSNVMAIYPLSLFLKKNFFYYKIGVYVILFLSDVLQIKNKQLYIEAAFAVVIVSELSGLITDAFSLCCSSAS